MFMSFMYIVVSPSVFRLVDSSYIEDRYVSVSSTIIRRILVSMCSNLISPNSLYFLISSRFWAFMSVSHFIFTPLLEHSSASSSNPAIMPLIIAGGVLMLLISCLAFL